MYFDVIGHCINCHQCAVVHSSGRLNRPPLHPIKVQHAFQIVGVDIMVEQKLGTNMSAPGLHL